MLMFLARPKAAMPALLIAATLAFAPGTAAAKMVLNRSSAADPDTLDPHVSSGNSAAIVLYDIFQPLMTLDDKGEVTAGAAESYTVSPDGLTYTFKLRPNLKWSDGTPLTAEDFVYSFRRIQSPETAGRYAQWFWSVKNAEAVNKKQAKPEDMGVKALDARTVQISLATPSPIFLEIMATFTSSPVPRHVVEKFGREWTAPERIVSNGAYMVTERVPQTRIKAVKNPNFYDAANVKIDEANYFPTENLGTVLNRFRAGELDVALNFPPDQIEWIRQNLPKELHIAPNLGVYYFLVNNTKPPLNDPRVRKALSMAIDREGMVSKLLNTGVIPGYSLVSPVVANYSVYKPAYAAQAMPARMAEAKKLLSEAGFGPGKPLKITLQFDTLEENRKMAVAMAAMWKPLGVDVELANSEFRDLTRRARTGDYDIMRWAYFSPFNDASAYLNLLRTGDASNFSGFANAEYDKLMLEANTIIDMKRRAALMYQAEQILLDTQAIIPVYHYVARRLIHTYVKNWNDNPRNANLTRYLSVERPAR
ncbi:MAG: peptide ABC transporter substrate-binding protein [Rhodospirillaceae bacterium]|nr:peptide ABC transporter substrate-binding protein [Rhodospirillaceae bacterium]